MENPLYLVMLEKSKTYNRMTKKIVTEHVENLRRLDDEGRLVFCGMYILNAASKEEAEALCAQEPLVAGGYASYRLAAVQAANRENNYLL
jgi:uncharacterized protein YciI